MLIPTRSIVSTLLLSGTLAGAAEEGMSAAIVSTKKAPVIDGSLLDWQENSAVHEILNTEGKKVGSFKLADDGKNLYAAFSIVDGSPVKNTSTSPEEILKGGDAVGIMLGSSGGEQVLQRLLATQLDGKAVLMAYRPKWPEKKPHTFSSPVGELTMDYVGGVAGAQVAFQSDEEGYTCEISIPWKSLNLQPGFAGEIPFDSQIIFSDPAGTVNASTAWWHAKGGPGFTTEDLPTEAGLYPDTWGTVRFFENDPGPRIPEKAASAPKVGRPITFELAEDTKASLVIADSTGFIVRELIRAEPYTKGIHSVYWNGRDRYDEPLPPGEYTWKLATFDGMGTRFHGSVGNSARPPFRTPDGKGSMGGQHGGPREIAADKTGIYIINGAEEGHPAMRKIDRDGYTLWKRSMGGFGVGKAVVSDGESAYMIHSPRKEQPMTLLRLEIDTGKDIPFANGEKKIEITKKAETTGGIAVVDGKLYYGLAEQDRIGMVNLADGKTEESLSIKPTDIAASGDGRLLICSGDAVHVYDPASGMTKPFITGLIEPRTVTTDGKGRVYVGDRGEDQQVMIFNLSDSKQVATLGTKGGRAETVMDFDPDALRNIKDLAVDSEGSVWVVEDAGLNRVARFSPAGHNELDLFGPVAYNTFGPDLDDQSVVYYQPHPKDPLFIKTRLDYEKYQANPLKGSTEAQKVESVILFDQETEEGGVDLMSPSMASGYAHVVAFTAENGHRYLWRIAKSNRATLPDGAAIYRWHDERWIPAAFVSNKKDLQSWSDLNGDGMVQENERYVPPPTSKFAWLDRKLQLFGYEGKLTPARILDNGVPDYRDAAYAPYMESNDEPHPGTGWVFNSMPDDAGAIYYAGNYGPHRHRTFWDRAAENAVVKVADGKVQWVVGNNDPYERLDSDMSTVSGVAGVVDDIVLVHTVEPAKYIAFTNDGFTLGSVNVDENGKRPSVGPTAIYIENFTGLFVEDPETKKRLLYAVSSGDDRILEVTGPGEVTRTEGKISLKSAFTREPAPVGNTTIPYETWWGNVGREYGVDGKDWEWTLDSKGLAIHENETLLGDIRLRRDGGSLHVLANVLDPPQASETAPKPGGTWGDLEGVELMLGEIEPVENRRSQPGDVRIFLSVDGKKTVALAYRHDASGWEEIKNAKVARLERFHGLGWRLEAEIPLETFPEISSPRLQQYRRGNDMKTLEKTLPDITEPIRLNAAFHLNSPDGIRRIPWVDDKAAMDNPQKLNPSSWGFANTLANLSWPEAGGISRYALFRAPASQPARVSLVSADLTGRRFVDTPGPGDFLYWLAPVSESGMGLPVGPVRPLATMARFAPFPDTRVYTLDELPHLRVPLPFTTGMVNIAVKDASSVRITASGGAKAHAREIMPGVANIIVQIPDTAKMGDTFPVSFNAKSGNGTVSKTIHVITGADLMAGLSMGVMDNTQTPWKREPADNSTDKPKHNVEIVEDDEIAGPAIHMDAWNSDNRIIYPLETETPGAWQAEGWFRLLSRSGGTTTGIVVKDSGGKTIAELKFKQEKIEGESTNVLAAQNQILISDKDEFAAIVNKRWQPFSIEARSGKILFSYGQGTARRTLEAPALEGSEWNQPASLEIYQGGRTSGRSLKVGNLGFTKIPESLAPAGGETGER